MKVPHKKKKKKVHTVTLAFSSPLCALFIALSKVSDMNTLVDSL